MCSGSPRVSTPPPAPTPAPPIASPSGDEIAPTLKVAEDKMTEEEILGQYELVTVHIAPIEYEIAWEKFHKKQTKH